MPLQWAVTTTQTSEGPVLMTQPGTALTCPKCAGEMRGYERNGVTIDQCGSCRGIFLDRGELERLVDAESAYYQTSQAGAQPPQYSPPSRGDQHRGGGHGDDGYRGDKHSGYGGHDKRRRRGGFLGELFD